MIFKNIAVSPAGDVLMAHAVGMAQKLSNSLARTRARIKPPCWTAAENILGQQLDLEANFMPWQR